MANHASAEKRHRQSLKRRERNRHVRATIRNLTKKVRSLVDAGQLDGARETLQLVTKRIDQAVSKGIYHRKAGSRYISRLTTHLSKK